MTWACGIALVAWRLEWSGVTVQSLCLGTQSIGGFWCRKVRVLGKHCLVSRDDTEGFALGGDAGLGMHIWIPLDLGVALETSSDVMNWRVRKGPALGRPIGNSPPRAEGAHPGRGYLFGTND